MRSIVTVMTRLCHIEVERAGAMRNKASALQAQQSCGTLVMRRGKELQHATLRLHKTRDARGTSRTLNEATRTVGAKVRDLRQHCPCETMAASLTITRSHQVSMHHPLRSMSAFSVTFVHSTVHLHKIV